ncbi:MAG: hypothetical protein EOP85_05900 [Verrucomicrobiaceae bacterium]|nr:MAG: hypothetical protein EOP85_05900 [Verrucomicrobiaceae bacterium]
MPKISPDEYGSLKEFCAAWTTRFPFPVDLAPEHDPIAILEQFEKKSMAMARTSLGMMVNDLVEFSVDLPAAEIRKTDADFTARGIMTLSEVRRRYSRQLKSIIKRGRIRNEEDYYLVTGILADMSNGASDTEREQLGMMVSEYEGMRG